MVSQSDLTIRQFERSEVVLEGEFEVAQAHRSQVAFSGRSAGVIDPHRLRISTSDIGAGGVGFQAPMFLPRMLRGIVRIFDPIRSAGDDAHAARSIAFEHAVSIRRCDLTSREPSYFIGSCFEDSDERLDELLTRMTDRIAQAIRRQAVAATGQRGSEPDAEASRV